MKLSFPLKEMDLFMKTPLLNKAVCSRLLNIVNNMDIHASWKMANI